VGNRLTVFDLVQQSTYTLPFETKKNIRNVAISHDGRFLVVVDIEGSALFINFPRQVVLTRFHFKNKVRDIKFSPDDACFAVACSNGVQIWKTPSIRREFSPLTLKRNIGGHHDDTVWIDWSSDSQSIIIGSKDLSCRVYYRVASKYMAMSVLQGHRAEVVAAFFTQDDQGAYSIAADGAVFTWKLQVNDRISLEDKKDDADSGDSDDDEDEDDEDEDEDEDDSEADDDDNDGSASKKKEKKDKKSKQQQQVSTSKKTKRGTKWVLVEREFLWDPHTEVTSASYNKPTGLLLIGFNKVC
jgi:periodic tryptophan protein 2